MISNFLFNICGCEGNWTMETFIDDTIKDIREKVGDGKVLCALSGGVDSSVVAALLHKAIGDQLTCMFIDHGLLRKGEAESVMETFVGKFDMKVVKIDAQERFMSKLAGVDDPEQNVKLSVTSLFTYLMKSPSSLMISNSWRKVHCTRTSWKVEQRQHKRSNLTTTWVDCLKI